MTNAEEQLALPISVPEPTAGEQLFKLSLKLIRVQARVTALTKLFRQLAQECAKEISDTHDLISGIVASDSTLRFSGFRNGETVMAEKKAAKKDKKAPKEPVVETKKKKK